MDGNKRIIYYDVLRTIAIISIVIDHAALIGYMLFYNSFLSEWNLLRINSKIIRIALWEFSRLGVPLFLLLTGALILNKDFDEIGAIKFFYKNNLLPLITSNEIWVILHFAIAIVLMSLNIPFIYTAGAEIKISLKELIYSILIIKRSPYPNMWYLPMIIGMYLFLPYVSNILKNYWGILKYIVICFILILFAANDLSFAFSLFGLDILTIPIISTGFSGGVYGLYIVVGWYLTREDSFLKKINTNALLIILFCVILVDIKMTLMNYDRGMIISLFEYNNSIFQLIVVVSVFELMSRTSLQNNMILCVMMTMSKFSFPIYLLHYPVMLVVDYLIKNIGFISGTHCTARVLLDFIITMAVCILFCCIIPNRRLIRKYIFHMPIETKQEVK